MNGDARRVGLVVGVSLLLCGCGGGPAAKSDGAAGAPAFEGGAGTTGMAGSGDAGAGGGGAAGADGGAAGATGADGGAAGASGADGGAAGAPGVDGGGDGPALECLGTVLRTTAPPMITITAGVYSNRSMVLPGATVTALDAGGANLGTTTTSASLGVFRLDLTTPGTPLDLHLVITKAGQLDTYWYPQVPLSNGYNASGLDSFTGNYLDGWLQFASLARDNTKALAFVSVLDCKNKRIIGATVATTPAGTAHYFDGHGYLSPTATATDMGGEAVFLNLPPGDLQVSATWGGMALRSHHVTAVAGAITETIVGP